MPHCVLQVVAGLGGGLNIFAAMLLIVFRRSWSMLFTTDPVIVDRLDPVIVWLGLSLVGARWCQSCVMPSDIARFTIAVCWQSRSLRCLTWRTTPDVPSTT